MDFLDPKKNLRHSILLVTGYLLIAVAVVMGTIVLLYSAYGYGFGKNGTVIQNGFLYLSSIPNPANISLNGIPSKSSTNTRMLLPEGIYNVALNRTGYRTWTRSIQLDGGTVDTFTYPFLIRDKYQTSAYKTYSSLPTLATESLNRQWLVVLQPGSSSTFDIYDLTNATKPPVPDTLPSTLFTPKHTNESWQVVEWSKDDKHVLLKHSFDSSNEFIILDISDPTQSINLSKTFSNQTFTNVGLNNQKYDQYYLFNAPAKTLTSVTLNNPLVPNLSLTDIDAYSSYGNSIIYATSKGPTSGKEDIDIFDGSQTYKIKELTGGSSYLLNMKGYNGTTYVAAGDAADNKVYVFKNPIGQLGSNPKQAPVPAWVLFVKNPNYLSFSVNYQFIMAESGQQFGVYDIENGHGYNYTSNYPLDSPQVHATWMDGFRLTYTSGGKQLVFEYDNNYPQQLVPSNPNFLPFFDTNYKFVYIFSVSSKIGDLTKTTL